MGCRHPYLDPALPADRRAGDLLGRMNLAEKIAQLDQIHAGQQGEPYCIREFYPEAGSIISFSDDPVQRNDLQRRALEATRLGIPLLFAYDVIHGYRTVFPIPLAQACSWNPELVRRACRAAAAEASAAGIDWTFAPMIDVSRDPRWGRVAESFGEDPHATGVFCAASVRGYQGDDLTADGSLAACLKHFVGYSRSEGGRDYHFADVSRRALWEVYLPLYEAGVRAGARTVMSAFNDLDGIPASANPYTLTEILRNRWEFDGVVVSDWNAVVQLVRQGFAADGGDAAARALGAGVDIDMVSAAYRDHLARLVSAGAVTEVLIDRSVLRVLRLKFELGLFERPYTRVKPEGERWLHEESLKLAEDLAAQSMVLLKNESNNGAGLLPLSPPEVRTVALVGPLADNRDALLGSWRGRGRVNETISIREGLEPALPESCRLICEPGCGIDSADHTGFAAAAAAARGADVVVLCLGESASMSGEDASRASIALPGVQENLLDQVAEAGRPVVLVVVSGRPVDLQRAGPRADAVVAAWQPGTRGGAALADLLTGKRNFSGRLSITFPRVTEQIPVYHSMRPPARPLPRGAYQDVPNDPLYPFVHGLSYTAFRYGEVRLSAGKIGPGDTLTAEVAVANTGDRVGEETVFWYLSDPVASISRPVRELKHFQRQTIPAGESRVFRFEIEPVAHLSFPDDDGNRILEPGMFTVHAGKSSASFRLTYTGGTL